MGFMLQHRYTVDKGRISDLDNQLRWLFEGGTKAVFPSFIMKAVIVLRLPVENKGTCGTEN